MNNRTLKGITVDPVAPHLGSFFGFLPIHFCEDSVARRVGQHFQSLTQTIHILFGLPFSFW